MLLKECDLGTLSSHYKSPFKFVENACEGKSEARSGESTSWGWGGRILFFQLSTRQNFINEISRGEVESIEKEILIYVRLLVLY